MGTDIATGDDHLTLVFHTAIAMPIGIGANGQPQFMPVQDGTYRIPMRKETALEYAEKLKEAAEALKDTPAPTNIVLASNMRDVEGIAKQDQHFRGQ